MSIFYLIEVRTANGDSSVLSSLDIDEVINSAQNLPELKGLNLFSLVEGGYDPLLKDEYPPLLVIQAMLADEACLEKLLASRELGSLIDTLGNLPLPELRLLQEAMLFDTFMSSDTSPGLADISYLVNYQRPAEDETAFLDYYRAHHPQILMNFPDIRRVELGLPIEWTPVANIEHANRMLYCEVSFDSIESLNIALNSDLRVELRKDYDFFPPFSGPVTHFAMHRRTLI